MWFLLRSTLRFSVIGFLWFNIDQDYVETKRSLCGFTFTMRKRKENATRSNRTKPNQAKPSQANGLEKDYGNNKENVFGDLHRQWTTDLLKNIEFR